MTSSDLPEDAIENFISFTNATREKAISFLEVGKKKIMIPVSSFLWALLAIFVYITFASNENLFCVGHHG